MIRVALRHPGIDHAILCGKYGDRQYGKREGVFECPYRIAGPVNPGPCAHNPQSGSRARRKRASRNPDTT